MKTLPNLSEDPAFLHGHGLFETIRIKNGKITLLDLHLNRLKRSAKDLGIPDNPISKELIHIQLEQTQIKEGKLKLILTPTKLYAIPTPENYPDTPSPVTCILTHPKYPRTKLNEHKTLSYIQNNLELAETHPHIPIFLNEKNELMETPHHNVFLKKENTLYTPPIKNILPGVYRQHLINTKTVIETPIPATEIQNYDEIFLTNAVHSIIPISQIHPKLSLQMSQSPK